MKFCLKFDLSTYTWCDAVDLSTAVSSSSSNSEVERSVAVPDAVAGDYYWQQADPLESAKRAPSFRLGKRFDYSDHAFDDVVRRAPTFRLGKRAPSFRLGKRAPSFRLG